MDINWEKVYSEVARTDDDRLIPDFDYEDAKQLVHILADRFVIRDLETLRPKSVETRFEGPLATGVADLQGDGWAVDWKIRVTGDVDSDWQGKQLESWQWRITAYALDLKSFIYRGVSRITGKVREITIDVPFDNAARTEQFLKQLVAQRDQLIVSGAVPWPQNRPWRCKNSYKVCAYYQECVSGREPVIPLSSISRGFSYSAATAFLDCQEIGRRYYLNQQDKKRPEGTEETSFGSACHRGIAEVYRQVLEEKNV